MSRRFSAEKVEKHNTDILFLALLILLVGIGLSVLFSSSYYYADKLFGNSYYFLKRQMVWLGIGAVLCFAAARISLQHVKKLIPVLLIVSLVLMLLTFIPGIGTEALGAKRWIIVFGNSFQPSELTKLSLILYLAHMFTKNQDKMDNPFNAFVPPVIVTGIFVALTYLQNDYSTSLFILFIALIIFFIAGVRLRYFLPLGLIGLPLSVILLFTKEHRVQRIMAFLDPQHDPSGANYQVMASQTALMQGGLWGVGIGRGTKKLGGLPEAHSDFVFAVLGEETGFLGVIAVIALFVAFAYKGFSIAFKSQERFRFLLAFGLTACILFQGLLNMAVVAGLVPATGIPLPFFSAGGSSVLISLIMCGLLINVSRRPKGIEEAPRV